MKRPPSSARVDMSWQQRISVAVIVELNYATRGRWHPRPRAVQDLPACIQKQACTHRRAYTIRTLTCMHIYILSSSSLKHDPGKYQSAFERIAEALGESTPPLSPT